jgi:hypothetical protein
MIQQADGTPCSLVSIGEEMPLMCTKFWNEARGCDLECPYPRYFRTAHFDEPKLFERRSCLHRKKILAKTPENTLHYLKYQVPTPLTQNRNLLLWGLTLFCPHASSYVKSSKICLNLSKKHVRNATLLVLFISRRE